MAAAPLRAVEDNKQNSPIDTIPEDLHSYFMLRATGLDDIRNFRRLLTSQLHGRVVTAEPGFERYIPGGEWLARGHTSLPRADETLAGRQARTLYEKLTRVGVDSWMKSMNDVASSPKGDLSDNSALLPSCDRFVVVDLPHKQVAKITNLTLDGLSAEGRKEKSNELARAWAGVVDDLINCLDALRSGNRKDVRCLGRGFKMVFIGMTIAELAYWQQVDRVLYSLVIESKREAWRQQR